MPTPEELICVIEIIPGSSKVSKILRDTVNVGNIAAKLARGQWPTEEENIRLLKTIPGMEDVMDIGAMTYKAVQSGRRYMGWIEQPPDDG